MWSEKGINFVNNGVHKIKLPSGKAIQSGKLLSHPVKRAALLFTSIAIATLTPDYSIAQETLNVPSYYGGRTSNTTTSPQSTSLQTQQQQSIQNYQNLVNNIQINQGLMSQLSESSQVVANPNTGEIRTVGANDPTPSGWMRLDVTQTANGYTLGNNAQGGQFSYTIQQQPTTTLQSPDTLQIAQSQQTPSFTYNPNTAGAQTTVTNNTQTTVGDTTTQTLNNGATVTSTPTETVDTEVTTITTADSETVITETTTTTLIESTVETPVTVVTGDGSGGGLTYATQAGQAQQATQTTQATQATGYVSPYSPSNPYNAQTTGTPSGSTSGTMTALPGPPLVMNETATGTTTTSSTPAPAVNTAPQATFYTAPSTPGAQTTVTNDTQTTVGETTTQTLDNGSTVTATPTETVDTTVTTTTTPDSQTIVTETTTTTVTEGTIETPVVISSAPAVNLTPEAPEPTPVPNPGPGAMSDTDTGTETVTISDTVVAVENGTTNTTDATTTTSGANTAVNEEATETTNGGGTDNTDASPGTEVAQNTADETTGDEAADDETDEAAEEGTDETPEGTQTAETTSPAQIANSTATSSGPSQAEREAAAARAAEEERRRREEYIRMQQEASNLRQGSQDRAMQLLEDDNTTMMGAASGQMGSAEGMMDPQRMSIFSQNARIKAGNNAPNVSAQIASLSNTIASVNKGLNDGEAMGGMSPCPPILANACEEAANRLADELEGEIDNARDENGEKVDDELEGVDEDLAENEDRAKDEQDRRDRRSDRQKRIDAAEEEQERRANELGEEGDELEERGNEQQERRARLEQEERDLRKQEQDARRNGDPNCRGPECRAIREQRQQNSRDITDLAREEGQFQADQARFQGKVQDFQRRQARLDEMRQGDPRYETQRMRNDAHRAAADAQSEVDRLREEQLNLRRQGGSGSRQDRAYDQAIERAERAAQAAANNAELADRTALKAEFYANGMQDEWKEYENARKASDAFNNYVNANNEAADLRERMSNAFDALDAAKANPDFDPDSLADLEAEANDLKNRVEAAQDAARNFAGDIGDTTERLTGTRMSATNDTAQKLTQTLSDISHEFAERQRLSNLSDAELAQEIDMIGEARERVAAARNGLGGEVQDPGGAYTQRYNELETRRADLQDRIDNFNPGGNGPGIVFGADEAYKNMQAELADVESELSGMNSIAAANSAVDRVASFNEWSDSLTDGLPLNADGSINRAAFANQVSEVAQAQMNLVQANGNLEAAKNNLAQAEASGDGAAIERAQSQVNQYSEVVDRITDQFALNDINIQTNEDGEYIVDATSVGGSTAWAAAAEGVSKFQAEAETARQQLASARGTVPAANEPAPVAPANDNSGPSTGGTTERIVEVASEPVLVTEPPLEQPGGFFQSIVDMANDVAEQAQKGAAMAVASTTKPSPTIADQHELIDATKQEARERRGQALSTERELDSARFDAEMAQKEAEFQRSQADETVGTRERQADEYVGFADYAEEQATKKRDKAAELEAQAADLRQSASRFDALADGTDDRSLARDARAAADDNEKLAAEREAEAQRIRSEAAKDDARAAELTARENEIRDDATDLETKAQNAEADAARAQAEVERLEAEAARLNGEAAKLDQLATTQANDLAETQRKAFNELINNPPEGWRWSSLSSSERSTWLNENIPQWDNLNTDQRIEFLQKLELGEAANDFKEQNARYEEFNNSSQGQRSTKEMLESRQRDLVNMQDRLKELNDMTFWNDEEEAEAKRLKEGLETGTARLRSDQRARNTEEMLRYEAWQEANRKLWAVNDEKRAEEVQRHVDEYATLQAQVGNARNIQAARSSAFDTREAEIKSRIDNPTSAIDAEAAQGELSRLQDARKYWEDFDARTIAGSEAIAAEKKREITYYGTMNGLGEIGFEDNLEERANAKLMADTALNTSRQNTATSVQTAVSGIDFTEADPTVWESIITGYDATTGAIEDTAVGISSGVGALYGVGKGTVKAFVGLADVLIVQSLDTYYETLELYAEEATGVEIDIFGSENLDTINTLSESNFGELGMKFVIGEGKKISDGLDKLDSAYQTGSLSDAFTGSAEVTAVGAELFADPAMIIGGGGKVISVLRGLDKVDEFAQAANVLDDVVRGADALGDLSRTGNAATDVTRGADVVGDSVRFTDAAHAPELTGGAYQGLDELLGPEFANAFGEVPKAPVYPPARPAPLRPGPTGTSTPLPPRDGPFIGLDELLGPEFANALDGPIPGSTLAPDSLPYQGLDELLGPEFANAFGEVPRAPVYPPVRPSPLRPGAGTAPSTPLAPRDGPFQGLDELLGPEFANAFDDAPRIPLEPGGGPYQGLDELLGPEFANAFGEVPKAPVYPPARPAPLRPGANAGTSTPLPPRDGPYIGLDELLGPEFRNAFDDPFPGGGLDGPIPPTGGPIPPTGAGRAANAPIPPTNAPGARPVPVAANSNAPLLRGESGVPVNNNPAIPPTNAPGARPAPSAANTNAPLVAGETGVPIDIGRRGPTGTLADGAAPASARGPNGTLADGPAPAAAGDLPAASGTGVESNLPPGVVRTADGLMQVPQSTAPVVTARQAGNFIVLEDAASGTRQLLELGDEVGRGSFTVVNDLAGRNRGSVIKVSKEVDPITARLDNVGTEAFTDLPKAVKDNFVYTPEPRGEFRISAANDNAALAGKNIRIAEKAPVPTYSQTRGATTAMTADEVTSISRAQDLVNESGHVILDLKSNNFGFQDLPNGLKRTVVHDAGGTVPTVGATATERAANAKTVQRALMSPDEGLVTQFREAMSAYDAYKIEWAQAKAAGNEVAAATARTNMANAAGRAFDITSGHGRAVLEQYGHLIDSASLGVPLDQIGFNPVLGFNQDGVRAAARAAAANDNFTGITNAALGGF